MRPLPHPGNGKSVESVSSSICYSESMSKASNNISLKDVFAEVRALRRDISVFIPTESLDEYKNKKEVAAAYRDVRRHIARTKRA